MNIKLPPLPPGIFTDEAMQDYATAAVRAAEARHAEELLAYQITVDKLRAELAKPERRTLQAEGVHPAPCARSCEAPAYQGEIRRLMADRQPMTIKELEEEFFTKLSVDSAWANFVQGIRAAERHHGIGDKP